MKYGQLIKSIVYTNLEGQVDYFVDKVLTILTKVMMSECIQHVGSEITPRISDDLVNIKVLRSSTQLA